jgi:putative ubiquitin-RnfH superfamily antitoxin RatB of RatAB toxin-antitoxin module
MADSVKVETVNVQVVYALPDQQDIVSLELPSGVTLKQAIEASGLLQKYADIDAGNVRSGIYARQMKPDTVLRDLDRVEIYRPLIADPKEVRRRRAAQGKAMKKGAGAAA